MADGRACAAAILIGPIFVPGPARLAADPLGLAARDPEHWPDQPRPSAGGEPSLPRNAFKPGRPGPPDQAHEDRLKLVVGMVGGGDVRAALPGSQFRQSRIAESPGS